MVTLGPARRACALAVALGLVSGCKPNILGRPSLVDSERVLAVRSVPAEAKPDGTTDVSYEALLAQPTGDAGNAGLSWAFCVARKPLAVTGPVALECLNPSGSGIEQIGRGGNVAEPLPADACSVFGPSLPAPIAGQPRLRAADADTTGGYYQPVRVLFESDGEPSYAVGVTRISCGIGGATQEQSIAFAKTYRPNENPIPGSLTLTHASGRKETLPDDPAAATVRVAPGERVTLTANWAKCPTTPVVGDGICGATEASFCAKKGDPLCVISSDCPKPCTTPTQTNCGVAHGCTGSEPYVALDPVSRSLVDRREGIRVSWFTTDGDFEHDRTGRSEQEADETSSDNAYTAPPMQGPVHLWVALRDDRGGVGWSGFEVDVEP